MKEACPARTGYERFVRPILFAIDPERAHHLAMGGLRIASRVDPILRALETFRPAPNPKKLFGLTFANPVGLAAGLDKNGVAVPAWNALGFGFIEIGTVTAKPQPGNPKPRIFRFPEQRALINRLGFNNEGAEAIACRLQKLKNSGRWPQTPVGINIGKSKSTPLAQATEDYLSSFRALRAFGDYFVLNVSSPNTPGLRELQSPGALSDLLTAIGRENLDPAKPVMVKIAPDLASPDLEQIITVCETNHVSAIIATNTTLDHSSIPDGRDEEGGLSGAPLQEKSTRLVQEITARSQIPVIASGGIIDANSAREKIAAGAHLVQIYTGLIYRGPALLREIAAAIA
ncbi:MAG TPA: quinone-dependent dihydroorotate dehydrogenase [Chthoniobacterales bacterium]|nr:quinone-dependent dihydroorotate dehydrogenase [Chthoniobacterales bacterium]